MGVTALAQLARCYLLKSKERGNSTMAHLVRFVGKKTKAGEVKWRWVLMRRLRGGKLAPVAKGDVLYASRAGASAGFQRIIKTMATSFGMIPEPW